MTPFLQEIARYYVASVGQALSGYCFVFPNKRAGVFFDHFLAEAASDAGLTLIHPEVTSITDFVTDVTDLVEASRVEQLFILYRCYREVMRSRAAGADSDDTVDFNKFQYWGDVLLSDFTDVDKYMVDPAELFHNIEALREISSNYLTPEQIEVIRRYWGDDKAPREVAEFWNHVVHQSDKPDHDPRRSTVPFVRLWQVMKQLYDGFNAELSARRLAYQGMTYRRALEIIRDTPAADLPYDRYVFIGFSVLSTVEERLFATLRDKGVADFFWDYASPAFDDSGNRATRFMQRYVHEFPCPADAAGLGRVDGRWPQIEVIGVPSVSGQTKVMHDLLADIVPEGDSAASLLRTAVVLPDENLCRQVLDSMPDGLHDINVTMGFPMRNTPVASLISSVISMQLRSRKLRFEDTFFRDDVLDILSHPIVRSIDARACDAITRMVNDRRLFNIPRSLLLDPAYASLHPLFDLTADAHSSREVFRYLERLVTWLLGGVRSRHAVDAAVAGDDDDADADTVTGDATSVQLDAAGAIEAGLLSHYLAAIGELRALQRRHLDDLDVDMADSTVFHLVERLMAGETVRFEGVPLRGLQVMGMLETRAIDFDNIIIMSMNERVFPRRHFSKSFIPPALRRGYGMATIEHQESISAYYFYRLLSRASRVWLLYDSRTEGTKSGEPSRYVNQLRYLYRPPGLTVRDAGYRLGLQQPQPLQLAVTGLRRERVAGYTDPVHPRYISATSINNFLNCPIQFALSYLEGYYDNDDVKDFFDEATFGSVLHQVVERLYTSLQTDGRPVVINRAVINSLKRPEIIMPRITQAINKLYLGRPENDPAPLAGDAALIARMMLDMVRNMLSHELDFYDEFTFISGEQKKHEQLRISDRLTINFSYTIDRIDSVTRPDGTRVIRIIDYKTGSDEVSSSVDGLFANIGSKSRNKAILQLFLYCNAFVQNTPGLDSSILVQPMIYRFRTIGRNLPPEPLKINRQVVEDYRMFNDEIMARLDEALYDLFYPGDDDHPLVLTCPDDDHACKYCKFTPICLK